MSQVFNTWLSKDALLQVTAQFLLIETSEQCPEILEMLLCVVTADQYVVHIDSYSTQVSCELLHNILEVSRHRLDSKWGSHL